MIRNPPGRTRGPATFRPRQATPSLRRTPLAQAFIALGSNLGDRLGHLRGALAGLRDQSSVDLLRWSDAYETAPVGFIAQDPFLNAAAEIRTTLPPEDLLGRLMELERQAGRVRADRWGPRTLDLDLLLYDDLVIQTPEMTLPHPRMHERWFVLQPLAAIAPDQRHPTLMLTIAQLLKRIPVDPSPGRIFAALQPGV